MNLHVILMNRSFLICLFIVNLLGTIYGFLWYKSQLVMTPMIFIPFVPDSPTASMFFTIVLFYFIFNRNTPYIEALAVTSLFKYGVWAVVMNLLTWIVNGSLDPVGFMLMISHGGMAIQGLLYTRYYKINLRHLTIAGIVLLHNEIIDYVYGMMPIYGDLADYMKEIGYFTFWLSIFTILLVYFLTIRRNNTNDKREMIT